MEKGKILIFTLASVLLISAISCRADVPYDVIVVRADIPTDYVVASIYANAQSVPLVLVNPDSINAFSKSELSGYRKAGNQLLLIIGGDDAISGGVENELKDMGYIVNRLWDWNRYGTAARVSIDLWGKSETAVISNGEDYSVFLTAQREALETRAPILFSTNESLPGETRDALETLGTRSVSLVGLGAKIENELSGMGISVKRIEGKAASDTPAGRDEGGIANIYFIMAAVSAGGIIAVLVVFYGRRRASVILMTDDEEKIIEILRLHGKTDQNKLASLTGFSKPRLSRIVRGMEERGIIEREKYKKTLKVKIRSKIALNGVK